MGALAGSQTSVIGCSSASTISSLLWPVSHDYSCMQEWTTPQPSKRPDTQPEFEKLETPLPKKMPGDPEQPDEEEEEEREKKKREQPDEDDPDKEEGEEEEEEEVSPYACQQMPEPASAWSACRSMPPVVDCGEKLQPSDLH